MKVTLLSSCGLAIEQDGQTLLIDALNKQFRCYYGLPPEMFSRMMALAPPFDVLCGILCTHAHPDHYNEGRTQQLAQVSGAPVFVPRADTPQEQIMQLGPFRVSFYRFPHIPVPGWDAIDHGVFLVEAAGQCIYVTGDAQIDAALHRSVLAGRRVDAAFWNGQYLSYPQTRALLAEAAKKNYVYHIPIDEKDVCGIRRKCERNMARFGAELSTVTLLEAYPSDVLIE